MKCSFCSKEINGKYCSSCGQYFKGQRVNMAALLADLFNGVFSVEKSLFQNIRVGLTRPEALVLNYWNGFRGYYYSPGRFLALAALFLVVHYAVANDFLGIVVTSTISSQFVILFTNIALLSFSSYWAYIAYKRSYLEHLMLNMYTASLWVIVFFPVSALLSLAVNDNTIEQYFYVLYHVLVAIWNSRVFDLSPLKRFLLVGLNLLLLYALLVFIVYKTGEF